MNEALDKIKAKHETKAMFDQTFGTAAFPTQRPTSTITGVT